MFDEIELFAMMSQGGGSGGVSSVNGKTGVVVLTPSDIGLGTVFNLKGSKATTAELPDTGNEIGDVWYVADESVGYIWLNDGTSDRWEQLGLPIDLSSYAERTWVENKGYQTATQVSDAIASAIGNAIGGSY